MKTINGKAIYNPTGKAAEYARWACNFYTGCSNNCTYCYCKRGVMASTWSNVPKLKKCFKDEEHALEVFEKELNANLHELRKHGLFFSFTTDPMLYHNTWSTFKALRICEDYDVPVKVLTKCTGWVNDYIEDANRFENVDENDCWRKRIAFGFTLTGRPANCVDRDYNMFND